MVYGRYKYSLHRVYNGLSLYLYIALIQLTIVIYIYIRRYNYSFNYSYGVYKPTYNSGGPSCGDMMLLRLLTMGIWGSDFYTPPSGDIYIYMFHSLGY